MKVKVKFVLMCHIVVFISYSLAVDKKQKSPTSSSTPETTKSVPYSGPLPWLDGSNKTKTEGQASDIPTELWVMVLKYLPKFKDLTNAILGKVRFETALDAPKLFIELGCEDLHSLHNEIANNPEEAQKHFKSNILIYKQFLESPIFKDATFVLLWKLTSTIFADAQTKHFAEIDISAEISELVIPYVRKNIEKKKAVTQVEKDKYQKRQENFVKYTKHLTLFDHGFILSTFLLWFPSLVDGWIYAGYALILEHSKHLENRVPCLMMNELVEIFNGGNGQYLLFINSPEWTLNETSSEWSSDIKQASTKTKASDKIQLQNRFEINWNFSKGQLTDEDKKLFVSYNFRKSTHRLHAYYTKFDHKKREHFYYAFVISAFTDFLLNPKSNQDLFMNFAWFDLAKDDPFVEKCRIWLVNKCKGNKMLESGLNDQMVILDGFQSRNGLSIVDAYNAVVDVKLFGKQNVKSVRYFRDLVNSFSQRFESDHVQIYTDLIKMMKVAIYTRTDNLDLIYQIHHVIISSIQIPHILNNPSDEFFEMDELHSILMQRYGEKMFFQGKSNGGSIRDVWRDLFRQTFDVANWIFLEVPNETDTYRKKRRFFLKLLWQLASDAFQTAEAINQSDSDRITEMQKLVYRVAKSDDMSETSLIRDYQIIGARLIEISFSISAPLSWELTQMDDLDFNFVYKPFNETGASDVNPLVFLCIVNSLLATFVHGFGPHPQLIKNYITVEKKISELTKFEPNIRNTIASTILFFHQSFINILKPYKHMDLKIFIDSMIGFLLNRVVFGKSGEYKIMNSMNLAILESGLTGDELKTKLGNESIEMLDEYHQRLYVDDTKAFNEKLRRNYENVKKLLGFELVEPKEGQSNTDE